MTVPVFLDAAEARHITLRVANDSIAASGPITDLDRSFIKAHKAEIMKVMVDRLRSKVDAARFFGARLDDVAEYDGKSVTLWGVTLEQVIIFTGEIYLGVDFEKVSIAGAPLSVSVFSL